MLVYIWVNSNLLSNQEESFCVSQLYLYNLKGAVSELTKSILDDSTNISRGLTLN